MTTKIAETMLIELVKDLRDNGVETSFIRRNEMGTRHLTVVIKDNKIRLSQYGQWDGYFRENGEKFFNFVKGHSMGHFAGKIDLLKPITSKYYEENIQPEYEKTKSHLAKRKLEIPFSIMFPQFSRDTGVDILEIIIGLNISNESYKFPVYLEKDCSWCEFIYVLDLDDRMVYMLTNWEFKGKPESVPDLISKNYPMDCCYKSKIDELPSIKEIKKILKSKREDGFACD